MNTLLQSQTISLPRLGQFSTEMHGIFIGVCPGQDGQSDYALLAYDDERTLFKDVQWGEFGKSIEHARSDWDGAGNTLAMAAAGSQLAKNIEALEVDGIAGFYLPARHELRMIKLVAPQLITDDWHWSSTQFSALTAWCQSFDDGTQDLSGKHYELRARAVRRFLINSVIQ